jgi:hypothetical protein
MQIPFLIKKLTIKPLEERHFVTLAVLLLIVGMLLMARENPELWEVELFKTLLTAVVITGFLNMILSYHFSANKTDAVKSENTAKAFEAIAATAQAATTPDAKEAAARAAAQTADAAQHEAEQFQDLERNK